MGPLPTKYQVMLRVGRVLDVFNKNCDATSGKNLSQIFRVPCSDHARTPNFRYTSLVIDIHSLDAITKSREHRTFDWILLTSVSHVEVIHVATNNLHAITVFWRFAFRVSNAFLQFGKLAAATHSELCRPTVQMCQMTCKAIVPSGGRGAKCPSLLQMTGHNSLTCHHE